ncbi:MAG: hypothetical protein KatS3mg104_3035 [Phycisphaerae bacterium]|nr:MAG: hypothetical protein KatS3mg104_3035 [Phycisphaerae bacterium]
MKELVIDFELPEQLGFSDAAFVNAIRSGSLTAKDLSFALYCSVSRSKLKKIYADLLRWANMNGGSDQEDLTLDQAFQQMEVLAEFDTKQPKQRQVAEDEVDYSDSDCFTSSRPGVHYVVQARVGYYYCS